MKQTVKSPLSETPVKASALSLIINRVRSLRLSIPVSRTMLVRMVIGVVLVGGAGVGYYAYDWPFNLGSDSQQQAQRETEHLIASVGRLIVLPTGEVPTIATVSDPERLKDQPFFANAKVGDKVLIYTNAKKAILYDPVADKIVEVAPINLGTTPPPSLTPTP